MFTCCMSFLVADRSLSLTSWIRIMSYRCTICDTNTLNIEHPILLDLVWDGLFSLKLFKHLLLTVLMMFIRVELEAFVSPNDLMLNAPINKELPSSARARITMTATTALIPADWKQQTGRVIKCQDQHSKRKLKNKTLSWQSKSNAMVLHLNT